MNDEMRKWLEHNRETYEFYLLHAMLHDPLRRVSMLTVPVETKDFPREEYGLVADALARASKLTHILGIPMPAPPSREFLSTYIESAARDTGADEDIVREALKLVDALQDQSYSAQHYCVSPYFEAWYGSARAKRVARVITRDEIPDIHSAMASVQRSLAAAATAAAAAEDDPMDEAIHGQTMDRVARRSTGVQGLDDCMNGGWGDGECSLIFSGTGGGKSICAGQCVWWEASANAGWPLLVSTELKPAEYIARIVSAACGVKIPLVQDCANFAQIRAAVASEPGLAFKMPVVEKVLATIAERVRFAKVSPDESMDARAVLEREAMRYEAKLGHRPTLVTLDWLGTMADVSGSRNNGTSERAMQWEYAANSCVKYADASGIPTLVLAQAVNDAQLKRILTLNDIGISKGIGKNMVTVIGITNTIDMAGVKAAVSGKADMPKSMTLDDQFFCVCKSRKGEGRNIPVTRKFLYQKFVGRDQAGHV